MDKIEVRVLSQSNTDPIGMMTFLAKLTQRGHNIKDMGDLLYLYNSCVENPNVNMAKNMLELPHGTIKRFTPVTIAIVGASRRFLSQLRTHQVGIDFVSASLQYSDYTDKASFVVPYAVTKYDVDHNFGKCGPLTRTYLMSCEDSMVAYSTLACNTDNDTAGYAAPQGLRNILVIQANQQTFEYLIRLRCCNRNTNETQYVMGLIWEELYKNSNHGDVLFADMGPDCMYGKCREGAMCCKSPMQPMTPTDFLDKKWPLIRGVV